jgi:transposase
VLAYESGEGTLDEVADTFGVGRCTVARMMKLWRAGQSLAPLPHGGGYPATLDKQLLALLTSRCPATRRDALGASGALEKKATVEVHLSTVCRALQKLGLPRKSLAASKESKPTGKPFVAESPA